MSLDNAPAYSGGCQCGAVRFRISGALKTAAICHCRMCQKAFGGFYAPLVTVGHDQLAWTRGAPKVFRSSDIALRGFCADCGTPLTFEGGTDIEIAIAAFDAPQEIAPTLQYGVEGRLPYVHALGNLPEQHTGEGDGETEYYAGIRSFQHPDHDTDAWPLDGAGESGGRHGRS